MRGIRAYGGHSGVPALRVAEGADATCLGPLHGALLHCHAHFGLPGVELPSIKAAWKARGGAHGPHCTDTAPSRSAVGSQKFTVWGTPSASRTKAGKGCKSVQGAVGCSIVSLTSAESRVALHSAGWTSPGAPKSDDVEEKSTSCSASWLPNVSQRA